MKRPAFTLIELIVVISIVGLLSTLVTTFMIRSARQNQQVQAASLTQRELSQAIDRFSRVIRSTTEILQADQTTLKVHAYANATDSAPSEIKFYITNSKLVYSVIAPTGVAPEYTYDPASAVVYTMLSHVTNNAGLPVFQYYDDNNNLLAFPVTIASITLIEFLPSAEDADSILTNPIVTSTKIDLRNFKTNL